MPDDRYQRYLEAKRHEAREAARRERVERILGSLRKLKRGSELKQRTFTAEKAERATERARAAVDRRCKN